MQRRMNRWSTLRHSDSYYVGCEKGEDKTWVVKVRELAKKKYILTFTENPSHFSLALGSEQLHLCNNELYETMEILCSRMKILSPSSHLSKLVKPTTTQRMTHWANPMAVIIRLGRYFVIVYLHIQNESNEMAVICQIES